MELKFVIFYSLLLLELKVYSALNFEECPAGMLNVTEDDEISLTCGPSYSDISWYYSSDNTLKDYIGYCSGTSCYPIQSNKFRIQAEWSSWPLRLYKSTLDITYVTREEARFFYCKNSYWMYTCRLRVTVPADLVSENCNVEISNFRVQGACQVARMYSSDSIYKCTWSVNDAELPSGFEEPLTNWTDRYTRPFNRTYMRGNCSFEQDMPSIRYSYSYRISIDPGLQNYIVKTINIVPPRKPEINCSETVLEGSTVTCMCKSPNRGNPPAHFVWDGLNTDEILLLNVSRQKNSTKYTCRQTWGSYGLINTTVNYTLTVAYGPSDVNISIVRSENGTKTFICMAIDVFPSATFHWNILCGQTTKTMTISTCTLPARDTDGDFVVQCTASNTAFPHSSVEKNLIVNVPHTKTELSLSSTEESIRQADKQSTNAKDSSSSGSINGGLIGGVVAAVVFAIIIGAVIVVFIVKRRKDPAYNTRRRPAKNEHSYEDLTQNRCEVRQPTGASYEEVTRQSSDEHVYGDGTLKGQSASKTAGVIFVLPTA
ncbi:uncharacterized protein LOC112568908 isoform X2 [Pomacea canaliculata]|uniref:uncharacterized protein LOC112568908 isoform X2 n=1 Tax=Pomacea canaliculata TaxID=400727 RepID=UPI000D72E41D|nr:uncharacterized protein LOC112568908 isoform X2 [Pomacea canaliculata]